MSKKFSGTIIGAAAGLFFSHSILGAIVGGVLGNVFDSTKEVSGRQRRAGLSGDPSQNPKVREFVFVSNMVALLTSVAKADKEIHPNEVNTIKNFCAKTFRYTGHDEMVIENLIRESANKKLDLKLITEDTRRMLGYSEQLMLLRVLYAVAMSDRIFKNEERERIQLIANYLRINPSDHEYIKKEMNITQFDDSFDVLEVSPHANDEEVKEAYREKVKKYHPDKVSHLGKDFTELAKQKFQKIQDAYSKVSKERGF
ncbi:TerB family tellurite resistance protein [candidate division KSB1 bacterium]